MSFQNVPEENEKLVKNHSQENKGLMPSNLFFS